MNITQAHQNLMQLLNHSELRLSYAEHCTLRQSLQLLHQKALDCEEMSKQLSEKKEEGNDSPNE